MVRKLLEQLFEDLKLGAIPPMDEHQNYRFNVGSFEILLKLLDPGIFILSDIGPLPLFKREEFLLHLMKANFLGQGTGGSVLGLKEDESCLTLSLNLPYEMNYRAFKENLEDFINFIDYWKKEITRHEAEAKQT